MQFVKRTWNAGVGGKIAVGCGGLIALACLCGALSTAITPRASTPTAEVVDTTSRDATAMARQMATIDARNTAQVTLIPTASPAPENALAAMAQAACGKALTSARIEGEIAIVDCVDDDLLFNSVETFFKLARETFAGLPVGVLDCRFTATFTDKYGKESKHVWLRTAMTRATHDKIEWKNMSHAALMRLLLDAEKGDGNIVAVYPGAKDEFERETGITLGASELLDMFTFIRELETPMPQ